MKLLSSDDPYTFVNIVNLEDFPYSRLSKIIKGDEEPESKQTIGWSLLLCIKILETLIDDESNIGNMKIRSLLEILDSSGISIHTPIQSIARKASSKQFKLMIPKVFEGNWSPEKIDPTNDIPNFTEILKYAIKTIDSDNQYYIFIDGLDEILSSRSTQYQALGALIFEVNRLNKFFKDHSKKIKVIVLCRTDLFEKITGANKNKIRQSSSFDIDWYVDPSNKKDSKLIRMINLRASNYLNEETDIFKSFFKFKLGRRRNESWEFLLDVTRHTPRDTIQLFKYLQMTTKGPVPKQDEVYDGIREYSRGYFLPEIIDELQGYSAPESIEKYLMFSRKLGKEIPITEK